MPDPVENPTYLEHIRHFFEEVDIEHMATVGIDLSTYDGVKTRATSIYFATKPPDARMPPDPARRWSAERSQTFENWARNGCPLGEPTPQQPREEPATDRVRKDAATLTDTEVAALRTAFDGIMARPADDPHGYFALAGLHWYPVPTECLHHENRYNPWHRILMIRFEDALRSVPGCESVTLPYWDITARPPDFLYQPPFASYTLPQDIHPAYPAGYETSRRSADDIAAAVAANGIPATIDDALRQPVWEDFTSLIEAAHDAGHGSVGETLLHPDAAAFDPIFWFFHSNWERLWWAWQQKYSATTLATFRSTITGATDWLDAFNDLPPFTETADQTIDLHALGVTYAPPATPGAEAAGAVIRPRAGSLRALDTPRVADPTQASVRLKGVHRLSIPGTFSAVLLADGEEVGRRWYFQSTTPVDCASCREKPDVDLTFVVDVDRIQGRALSAELQLPQPAAPFGDTVPLSRAGDPTMNVRLLVERG